LATNTISRRIRGLGHSLNGLVELLNSPYMAGRIEPGACDFVFGNPHEPALPGFVEALQRAIVPQDKDWFAYKMNEPEATQVVADSLNRSLGRTYTPEHILMTNGTFAGLAVGLSALVDPGDEVIFISPPWFFYEALIESVGATPVRVNADRSTFDLDVEAIRAAITPSTRGIIVNSPNNPGGKIYSSETLKSLGVVLDEASRAAGQPVYLFSDEAYKRIIFNGASYPSPTEFYDNSLLLYTYGKTLLTPGQRLGYIAVTPSMPGAAEVAEALFLAQTLTGWAFPNAVLQHALADIENLTIDVDRLQQKRDRMVEALSGAGYDVTNPEGTFYIVARSPWEDDMAFTKLLAERDVYVLPGSTFELPGFIRISLTANDEMIERALPLFAEAIKQPAP
jgi:aspartate aminotransferase